MGFSIAIDGYVAAGKGTLASLIARKYGFLYLDTGAIYRSVTYGFLHCDHKDINKVLEEIDIEITSDNRVFVDGKEVTLEIRKQDVNDAVSMVCQFPQVREFATNYARKVANGRDIVMDGRDIGSVVLPNADVKFVIMATVESRVKRRYEQNRQKGLKISEEEVKNNIIKRDNIDKKNIVIYEDTVVIDNTNQTLEESLRTMCSHIDRKLGYTYD